MHKKLKFGSDQAGVHSPGLVHLPSTSPSRIKDQLVGQGKKFDDNEVQKLFALCFKQKQVQESLAYSKTAYQSEDSQGCLEDADRIYKIIQDISRSDTF